MLPATSFGACDQAVDSLASVFGAVYVSADVSTPPMYSAQWQQIETANDVTGGTWYAGADYSYGLAAGGSRCSVTLVARDSVDFFVPFSPVPDSLPDSVGYYAAPNRGPMKP